MNLRHAAALGLVGWYLMAPLAKGTEAPLSEWSVVQAFDSANDCQEAKQRDRQAGDKEVAGIDNGLQPLAGHNEYQARLADRLIRSAQCVATDDPRLKNN